MIYYADPKWLFKDRKDRWTGRDTVIVPEASALAYCRSLYGRPWDGFPRSGASPLVRGIQAEWRPDGYDGGVRLALHYDTMGDRRPGYAKVFAKPLGLRLSKILREPAGKKRIIHGQADGQTEWRVVSGHSRAFDAEFLIAVVVQTAARKKGFVYQKYDALRNTVNKQAYRGVIRAPAGTVKCIYVTMDAQTDPTDQYVYIDWHLIWDKAGWNTVQSQKGSWLVQTDFPVFKKDKAGIFVRDENKEREVLVFEPGLEIFKKPDNTWGKKDSKPEDRQPHLLASHSLIDSAMRSW